MQRAEIGKDGAWTRKPPFGAAFLCHKSIFGKTELRLDESANQWSNAIMPNRVLAH
jgi:hypothetical protein